MDWHELEKMKVTDLREMAKEKLALEGTVGMPKEKLVEALAKHFGVERPHKVAHGAEKTRIKQEIRALKARRDGVADPGDRERTRRKLHRLKRRLRRMAQVQG